MSWRFRPKRKESSRGGIGDQYIHSRQRNGLSLLIRDLEARRVALVASAARVMRGLTEQGFATNMERRGIW